MVKAVAQRSLPKRQGRNEDPTGRRTKKAKAIAVKAAKAAKAENAETRLREEELAKEKLAEMEVDESFIQKDERRLRIRRRSDLDNMDASTGSEGEVIPLENISSDESSDCPAAEGNTLGKNGTKVSFC